MATHGSLFSGVGGMDLGFDAAGFETLWQCEVNERLRSVLNRHWPDVQQYGDVASVKGGKVAPVDVISFGSPCQDLSIAGKRAGLAGSRSGLFHEAMRIVREMRRATKNEYPKAVVWENVTGALSSSKGADFAAVIDQLAKSGAVDIQWGVLDAQHFGVPQRRRRVFVVAFYSARADRGEVFAEPSGSGGDSLQGEQEGEEVAGSSAGSVDAGGELEEGLTPRSVVWAHDVSPCVASKWAKGTGGPAGDEVQNLVMVRRQPVLFVKTRRAQNPDDAEAWAGDRPAPTLNAFDNGSESRATVLCAEKHEAHAYSVRRLTPVECERLMGWPDDHTRWDADGKELADSPRYVACGNGVASPVAEYVARQVLARL